MIERLRFGALDAAVCGSGPTVVFLHGIGSSSRAFTKQLEQLGDRFRCVAFDAPGYRSSPTLDDVPSISNYADTVAEALDAGGITTTHLVGVSWGGVIAANFAVNHRRRVDRLILADTSRGSGTDPRKSEAMRARPDELVAAGSVAFAHQRAPRLVSANAPESLVQAVATDMAESLTPQGYRDACESMAKADQSDLLKLIESPTLIVVGAEDIVCPPSEAGLIQDLVPNSGLRIIDGAGHLANQEQPAAFNNVITSFISDADHMPDQHLTRSETTP